MVRHARLLVGHLGENHAMRDFRKHTGWYMSGYPVGPEVRRRFSMVKSLIELEDIVAGLDPTARIVDGGERIKRGHTNGPIKVGLPDGWLDGHRRHEFFTTSRCPTTTRSWPSPAADDRTAHWSSARVGVGIAPPFRVALLRRIGVRRGSRRHRRIDARRRGTVRLRGPTVGREGPCRRRAGRCSCVVVAADTTVDVDGRILEKPVDDADARRMLGLLSGRTHLVHTGVTILPVGVGSGGAGSPTTVVVETAVRFVS